MTVMNKIIPLFALFFFIPFTLTAQSEEPLADRLTEMLKTDVFNIGILLQSEAVFSLDDDNFNGGRAFDLGATRMDVRGAVDGNFTYRFQLDYRQQISILDAQVGYRFSDKAHLIAGAFKPFTSRELDPGPGDTDFINRARLVRAMMNPREIGLTLRGRSDQFNYALGVYNGTGLSRMNDNKFLYTVRLGYQVESEFGTFDFGFNGAFHNTESDSVGGTKVWSTGNRTTYGGFVTYNSDTFFGTVEFLQSSFERAFTGDETLTGFYITAGRNLTDKDQVLARYDYIGYDAVDDKSDLIVLGWNHQATSLISFQVNLQALIREDADNQMGISALMQFQF
ncbi:MAG: hypothetical protein EA360_01475 [Balneolaceae bacterium]|nr:MAG: hypothetical protein EA360_01475 [Balneolaceae bacterium]